MLEMLVSVPTVTAFAAVTVGLLVRDLLVRESGVGQPGRLAEEDQVPVRYRWYGLATMAVFLFLVALRFVTLAG
jgi:hypothetical protein